MSSRGTSNYGTVSPPSSASASAPTSASWHNVGPKEENPFGFAPAVLTEMITSKSLAELQSLGGIKGLAKGLLTDLSAGLSVDEVWSRLAGQDGWTTPEVHKRRHHEEHQPFQVRKAVFGTNTLPDRKVRGLLQLMLMALNDKVVILLCVVATISLALGLYQSLALPHAPGEPRVEWVDGVTIMAAVMIVVVVGALNDYQKERQFARLNKKVGRSLCDRDVAKGGQGRTLTLYNRKKTVL
jgi:P-type Ca2+ transporter type 2C